MDSAQKCEPSARGCCIGRLCRRHRRRQPGEVVRGRGGKEVPGEPPSSVSASLAGWHVTESSSGHLMSWLCGPGRGMHSARLERGWGGWGEVIAELLLSSTTLMENNQESRLGGCARMHLSFLPSRHTHPATGIRTSPLRCPYVGSGPKLRYFLLQSPSTLRRRAGSGGGGAREPICCIGVCVLQDPRIISTHIKVLKLLQRALKSMDLVLSHEVLSCVFSSLIKSWEARAFSSFWAVIAFLPSHQPPLPG